MKELEKDKIKRKVQESYGKVANSQLQSNCCNSGYCSIDELANRDTQLGYSKEEQNSVPEGASMGLGCGNPQAIADIKEGETVLDLGSGGGFDCFLAAQKVGDAGKVIGVDMTIEMLTKARVNAEKGNYGNVEFRLGEIENLPVADSTIDLIISNCVVNLSPDKQRVFKEAYRVLKNGGRLAISDIVLLKELPDEVMNDLDMYSACISGSSLINDLQQYLELAGFKNIRINTKEESREFISKWVTCFDLHNYITSATIEAEKIL